jgi:ATP-binding cassette subfamily C protein
VKKKLTAFVRCLLGIGRARLALVLALTVLYSLTEGIGIALLLPLLQVAGLPLGAEGKLGRYARAVAGVFHAVGLQPTLLVLLVTFAALIGTRALLGQSQHVMVYAVREKFGVLMRRRLYQAIGNANWQFLLRAHSADLTHALTAEIERVEDASSQLLGLVSRLLMLALYLAIALEISVPTTVLVLGCGAVLVLMLRRRTMALHRAGSELSRRTRNLYAATVEHLQSLKAAKIYGAQTRNIESFSTLSLEVADSSLDITRQGAIAGALFDLGSVLILVTLIYCAISVFGVAPVAVLLLLALFTRVTPNVMVCHYIYREFIHSLPAFENVMGLAERCAAEAEPAGMPGKAVEFRKVVRLEGVSFSYQADKSSAVSDLDLTIPEGELIALVGASGAGKSTIADLICGLLIPDSGRVVVDGVVLDERWARAWREQVGYVAQDTWLFHGSVRSNLLWARPQASEAELRAALEMAAATEFVDALPQGLDTVIGERGSTISHGERQRIALARALLRRPRLLILDEATNSLDAHTEERILATVEALRGDLTILMIAHRIAAVRSAGLIYVIDGGTVVESGSWNELCALDEGRLRAMCLSQGISPVPQLAPTRPSAVRRRA